MTERWDVKTSDGGAIAVWIEGDGQTLVLVHGSMSNHTAFAPLIGELRDEFTVFAMDRRGFGASPDRSDYSAEREFADVAAVVNAVAAQTRQRVVLFGHSWGASCALGAAPDLPSLRALVLYEPSLGLRYPPGSIDRIEGRTAAGDYEGALIDMLTDIVGLTEDEITGCGRHPTGPSALPQLQRSLGRLASSRVGTGRPTASPESTCRPCSSPDRRPQQTSPRSRRPPLRRSPAPGCTSSKATATWPPGSRLRSSPTRCETG